MDGRVVRTDALQIVIGNTQLYGIVKYTWEAKCDDGLLDVCIVHKSGMLERFAASRDFLLHREGRRRWVSYDTCTSVEIRTSQAISTQVDGEPTGHTPATCTIVPGSLKVIVPQKRQEDGLFSQE